METFFPSGEALIALERETLRKILNTGAFTDSDFSDLVKNANAVYYGNSSNQSPVFSFHCHFAIEDDDDVRRLDVGAKIVVDAKGLYTEVSYFFAISGLNGNPTHILRKVHFDFEPLLNRNVVEAKPSLHFQVPGSLPPPMANFGYQDTDLAHLAPWYEKPRIPSLPFSLAILFDILFHEFRQTDHIKRVLEDNTWRSIVNDAEMQIIYPYMQSCTEFLAKADRKKLFISHFLYGLDR